MEKSTFEKYYRNILSKASKKRTEKEKEYFSQSDILGNFRKIASFRGKETPVTIMDLGSKSLQSISDMVDEEFLYANKLLDERASLDEWDEKFVDAINYLFKLYASIREERQL